MDWSLIPHFDREEFDDPDVPGSGDLMEGQFLMMLVKLRLETGWRMFIHGKVGGAVDVKGTHGHARLSYHTPSPDDGKVRAVDFHFGPEAPDPREQWLAVSSLRFSGVGVYYDWGVPIGFHVDHRPSDHAQVWKREHDRYVYLLR